MSKELAVDAPRVDAFNNRSRLATIDRRDATLVPAGMRSSAAGAWIGLLMLAVFFAALWVLHSELEHLRSTDIEQALARVPWIDLLRALGFTALSYAVITINEWLALRYAGKQLAYFVTAINAFVTYAFAHNIGLSFLTGGSIRYRLYSRHGLSAPDIVFITGFASLSFGLGVLAIAGTSLLIEPTQGGIALSLPHWLVVVAAVLALAVCVAYLCAGWILKRHLRIGSWSVPVPRPRTRCAQLAIGTIDLLASCAAAYFLLPEQASVTFTAFCGAYVLAIFAGEISHVPGGIGVFEATMLLLLPQLPESDLLAALLLYRLVYYVLPLVLAAALWARRETVAAKESLVRTSVLLNRSMPTVGAPLAGLAVFIGGAVLLLSGVMPAIPERIATLRTIVPLPLVEASHLSASVAGFLLLVLARGLFRRSSGAYHLTALALVGGIVFSLLKGFDYEEALVCGTILAILFFSRSAFYRQSALLAGSFTMGWLISIAIVVAGVTWVGFVVNRDLAYSNELWTEFAFDADAPRFLRASVAIAIAAAGIAVATLIAPPKQRSSRATSDDLTRVRGIVDDVPETNARLALLGDKNFLFSGSGRAFIMYGVQGRSWIALGSPVGPSEEWAELLWSYRDLVDRHGGRPAFYEVDAEHLPLYLDLGFALYKIGEEALLPLTGFTLDGHGRKELRRAKNRGEREELSFELLSPGKATAAMGELRAVSDAWLESRTTSEKGFSLGFFDPRYLASGPIAVVRRDNSIVAFANVLEGADHRELSVDLMRHRPEAPHGTMDFLFVELLIHGAASGFAYFNMGMAPLSGLSSDRLAPLWSKIGNLLFARAGRLYNFEGLRAYKEKFHPTWRPKYLAAEGGFGLPVVLVDLATLISGGFGKIVSKQAGRG